MRRQVEDPGIISIAREDATIDLRVLILDATAARPDEEILARLAPDGWSRESGSRFEFLGTQAARGDFAGADGLTSTQILWEAHEGARPGRKFLFHSILVCPAGVAAARRREFDEFLMALEADLDGPATEPVHRALDEGWEIVTRPARRAISLSGFSFPLPTDPFLRRDLPVAAALDAADLSRERHAAGETPGHEEMLDAAMAHYNVALHQLWSQLGAPEERREGQRSSPREALELSTRMHAALALNLTLRAKLGALRADRPWRDLERLKQNATVLEALAEWFRGGVLTGEIRSDLGGAAAAPVGDYRELAFALSRGIDPENAITAARRVLEGHAALTEGRHSDAEEAGRSAIAATGGAWADGWRLAAAALYADGRLDAAAGASRRATTALP
ncbi:MAG: hypothetical protein HUU15_18430, partial [Candidatus Brocadiae bacterium]|nr:hypothetical protein [Candidatus Brocadiia bacterium]